MQRPFAGYRWLSLGMAIGLAGCQFSLSIEPEEPFPPPVATLPTPSPSPSPSASPLGIKPAAAKISPPVAATPKPAKTVKPASRAIAQRPFISPNLLVVGGGGAPSYNEISLEKNVLYFQRTLKAIGLKPSSATVLFANGNDGQETVRFLKAGAESYKAPTIPYLKGASTRENVAAWLQKLVAQKSRAPTFLYFTGHGGHSQDYENNDFRLWGGDALTVQEFTALLDRLPTQTPVVTVMAQCYSGGFTNMIYQGGYPKRSVVPHNRCGFFATLKQYESVGCTPAVNEADYEDYSSSFFAGLSGRNRIGKAVGSADYNGDRRVSFAEAHAFAKVDAKTTDIPISTAENWLFDQVSDKEWDTILTYPIATILRSSRPDQRYVVNSLAKELRFDPKLSYTKNYDLVAISQTDRQESTLSMRLAMELVHIQKAHQLRLSKHAQKVAVLNRLQTCEAGSIGRP
ncbi:Caspase domain-containing protein [Pantanalinema rosaneae CENA516]|uniref:Caspase domain-containing protein n=1 Tax=Pantanalinema rosaneae TaxID=1620701 RepID=UPI003D6F75F8